MGLARQSCSTIPYQNRNNNKENKSSNNSTAKTQRSFEDGREEMSSAT
jgi:hypothetical protein